MREYGSDFHSLQSFIASEEKEKSFPSDAIFLASGRQCLLALIKTLGFRRIWMPQYFCYEVIETIKKETNVIIAFYVDYPEAEQNFHTLSFQEGDVFFRANFFGLKVFFSNSLMPVPVIEDHSHDLLGEWATRSDADWCIASLRKTLPIPEGGVMWSPKGHRLSLTADDTQENESMCERRWNAMDLKSKYLRGEFTNKDIFRTLYLETEDEIETLKLSSLDKRSRDFLSTFAISKWYEARRRNWKLLKELVQDDFVLLESENDKCNVFSFIMLFKDRKRRDEVRKLLITESVYPAILWKTPENVAKEVKSFSERMLSVHCDGRYTEEDIKDLASRINRVLAL